MKRTIGLFCALFAIAQTAFTQNEPNYWFSAEVQSGQTLYFKRVSYSDSLRVQIVPPNKYWRTGTPPSETQYNYNGYDKPSGDLIIPESVVYNGIPRKVVELGDRAFIGCSGLTSVSISDSVNTIGIGAFYSCTSMSSITLGKSITSIGSGAFGPVDEIPLTRVNYNGTIEQWCNITFESSDANPLSRASHLYINNAEVTEVTFPEGVDLIKDYVFYGCIGLTSVNLAQSITSIGEDAFHGCTGLTSLLLPDGVISIGKGAFSYCTRLISLILPESLTSIGESAFSHCTGLTSIILPTGVTSIEPLTFSECTSLTTISVSNSLINIGWSAFSNCSNLTSFTMPSGVKKIGSGAFGSCNGLSTITLPLSLDTLESGAFHYCTNLVSLQIEAKNIKIEGQPRDDDMPFYGCTALRNVVFGDSVRIIPNKLLVDEESITSVTLGPSVVQIGSKTFKGCSQLTTIRSRAEWPPIITENTFEEVPAYADIIVPCGMVPRYREANYWNEFQRITEDCSAIGDVYDMQDVRVCVIDGCIVVEGVNNTEIEVFDMIGRMVVSTKDNRINVPTNGTYMIKIGNHTARKVVVVR